MIFASWCCFIQLSISSSVIARKLLSPCTIVFWPSSINMIRPVPVEISSLRSKQLTSTPASSIQHFPKSPHASFPTFPTYAVFTPIRPNAIAQLDPFPPSCAILQLYPTIVSPSRGSRSISTICPTPWWLKTSTSAFIRTPLVPFFPTGVPAYYDHILIRCL